MSALVTFGTLDYSVLSYHGSVDQLQCLEMPKAFWLKRFVFSTFIPTPHKIQFPFPPISFLLRGISLPSPVSPHADPFLPFILVLLVPALFQHSQIAAEGQEETLVLQELLASPKKIQFPHTAMEVLPCSWWRGRFFQEWSSLLKLSICFYG